MTRHNYTVYLRRTVEQIVKAPTTAKSPLEAVEIALNRRDTETDICAEVTTIVLNQHALAVGNESGEIVWAADNPPLPFHVAGTIE